MLKKYLTTHNKKYLLTNYKMLLSSCIKFLILLFIVAFIFSRFSSDSVGSIALRIGTTALIILITTEITDYIKSKRQSE